MSDTSPFDRLDTSEWNVTLHGQSYLYQFDATVPRNCDGLGVAPDYCICQNRKKDVSVEKQEMARRMAEYVTDYINEFLANNTALDVCSELTLADQNATLFQYNDKPGLYRLTLHTDPNEGTFETQIKVFNEGSENVTETFSVEQGHLMRKDYYDPQSQCTTVYEVKPFCYCRDLIRKSTPPR